MQSKLGRLGAAWRGWGGDKPLVRAMVLNWAFGMATGVFCALILLAFDFFGLRSLLWRSDIVVPGVAMLCAAFAFTFGGVVCAAAVMGFDAEREAGGRPHGLRLRAGRLPRLTPIAIAVRRRRNGA